MKTLLLLLVSTTTFFANAQTTWYEIPTSVDNKLNTIDFPSSNVGYIGGNDTLLLKTTDGGQSWSEIDFNGVTVFGGGEHILDLNFIDENIGYMTVGPYGGNYKTTDGGLNWTALSVSGNFCYVGCNFFFAEDDGFLGGAGCFEGELVEIVSGGGTTQATMNDNALGGGEYISQIDFLNANFGLASSSDGRIFRTTDGGVNWDSIPSSLTDTIPITSIKIIDDTLAFAGYEGLGNSGFGILTSTDAGLTWATDINSATFYYPDYYEMVVSNHDHWYMAAVPAGSFISGVIFENDGNSWNYWNVDQAVYAMDTYSDSIVWAVGDSGYVVVNVLPATLNISENLQQSTLDAYPNPFQNSLTVNLSSFNDPTLSILDASGKLIERFHDAETELNLEYLQNGIYFISVQDGLRREVTRVIKN